MRFTPQISTARITSYIFTPYTFMHPINSNLNCPCESDKAYKSCCRQYIEKEMDTPNAETLMRSRYTAFAQMNETYLRYSWHPETCPNNLNLDKETKWIGLNITPQIKHTYNAHEDTIEFVARYKINGKAFRLHEISFFTHYLGRWVYLRQA